MQPAVPRSQLGNQGERSLPGPKHVVFPNTRHQENAITKRGDSGDGKVANEALCLSDKGRSVTVWEDCETRFVPPFQLPDWA